MSDRLSRNVEHFVNEMLPWIESNRIRIRISGEHTATEYSVPAHLGTSAAELGKLALIQLVAEAAKFSARLGVRISDAKQARKHESSCHLSPYDISTWKFGYDIKDVRLPGSARTKRELKPSPSETTLLAMIVKLARPKCDGLSKQDVIDTLAAYPRVNPVEPVEVRISDDNMAYSFNYTEICQLILIPSRILTKPQARGMHDSQGLFEWTPDNLRKWTNAYRRAFQKHDQDLIDTLTLCNISHHIQTTNLFIHATSVTHTPHKKRTISPSHSHSHSHKKLKNKH
jgi:hypothetical protein